MRRLECRRDVGAANASQGNLAAHGGAWGAERTRERKQTEVHSDPVEPARRAVSVTSR
jgi:hypothetical protein